MEKTIRNPFELKQLFNQVNDYITSKVNDNLRLTHDTFFDFPDESEIRFTSYSIPSYKLEQVDLEALSIQLSQGLPKNIRESWLEMEHLTLKNPPLESLQIHFNDSTVQLIYHCTGQF